MSPYQPPVYDPPIPDLDEFPTIGDFWANDDGDYWVKVEHHPELKDAWRMLEAFLGMPLTAVYRTPSKVKVSDCEMGHYCEAVDPADYEAGESACDAHPDCPKVRCPDLREEVCWSLSDAGDDELVGRWATFAFEAAL